MRPDICATSWGGGRCIERASRKVWNFSVLPLIRHPGKQEEAECSCLVMGSALKANSWCFTQELFQARVSYWCSSSLMLWQVLINVAINNCKFVYLNSSSWYRNDRQLWCYCQRLSACRNISKAWPSVWSWAWTTSLMKCHELALHTDHTTRQLHWVLTWMVTTAHFPLEAFQWGGCWRGC